jgi:hypothetical protein
MGAAAGPVARQVKLRGAYGAAPSGTPALALSDATRRRIPSPLCLVPQ